MVEDAGLPISPEELLRRREAMMLDRFRAGGVQPMPGLREILVRFHGRLKLGVATSSPRVLATAALPAIAVDRYFTAITTGDEIARGKPDPQIYQESMAKLGVWPAESVVLEDAPAGALAGKRAGAHVIAVPSPLTAGEDFSDVAHERVANLFEASDRIAILAAG
jgi:HAD superfamily hydrolase (TIGR01509 family)